MILALLSVGLTLKDADRLAAGVFFDILDLKNPKTDED